MQETIYRASTGSQLKCIFQLSIILFLPLFFCKMLINSSLSLNFGFFSVIALPIIADFVLSYIVYILLLKHEFRINSEGELQLRNSKSIMLSNYIFCYSKSGISINYIPIIGWYEIDYIGQDQKKKKIQCYGYSEKDFFALLEGIENFTTVTSEAVEDVIYNQFATREVAPVNNQIEPYTDNGVEVFNFPKKKMARTYAYMPLLIKLIVVLFNLIFLYELLQMDYLSGEDFSSNVSTNIFIILISFTLCFILLLPLIIPIGIKKGKIPKVIKIKYQNPFYGIMINKKFIQGNTIESVDFQKNYKSNRIFLMIETSCKTQKYYLGNLNQNNNKCFCYNHLEQLESSLIKLVGLDKFLGDEM